MDKLKIFSKWEERSSVRNAPRRIISASDKNKFFSANLAPVLKHKTVLQLTETVQRKLEIQFLYRYLQFTEYLETSLVNKVIAGIMNDEFPIKFDDRLKDEAYKIYCDEAYHALQAHDTILQIKTISGEKPVGLPVVLQERLNLLGKQCPHHLLPFFELFFVCVSETLVSQELQNHVNDKEIHHSIQEIMNDHAKDEAIHALFFEQIMICLKKQLPNADYQWFQNIVPAFADVYLVPDKENLRTLFLPYLEQLEVADLIDDALDPTILNDFVKSATSKLYRIILDIENSVV
jgi:hypothetical protein